MGCKTHCKLGSFLTVTGISTSRWPTLTDANLRPRLRYNGDIMVKRTRSAGGVVLNKKGQVLVVNQRGVSWSLPKGHIEEGEEVLAAARREIHEESGLTDLTLVKPLGSYERLRLGHRQGETGAEMKHLTFFLFQASQEELKPIDPDNPEARWVERDQVTTLLTHPKDREFFNQILQDL